MDRRPGIVGQAAANLPATAISLASESGSTVAGWHVPAIDSRGVIVLLHPPRGTRLRMVERAQLFHSAGYSCVLIDFQAHGERPGDQIS